MQVFIKNVILYDQNQVVVGFVELNNHGGATHVNVKHSLPDNRLITTINGEVAGETIKPMINLDDEIFVCLISRDGEKVQTIASGIINPREKSLSKTLPALPPITEIMNETQNGINRKTADPKATARREIDAVLRAVCSVDERKKGRCGSCPYREFFYGEPNIEPDKNVPICI